MCHYLCPASQFCQPMLRNVPHLHCACIAVASLGFNLHIDAIHHMLDMASLLGIACGSHRHVEQTPTRYFCNIHVLLSQKTGSKTKLGIECLTVLCRSCCEFRFVCALTNSSIVLTRPHHCAFASVRPHQAKQTPPRRSEPLTKCAP